MSSPAPNAPVEPPRCIEPPAQRPTLARRVARIVLLNLVVLAAYRTLFVWWFGEDGTLLRLPEVLWQGLRIDVTLLSVELAALGVLALVGRYLRPSTFLAGLWLVTSINVVCVLLNLAFYGERRQHMWEMLLANLDRVSQIAVAAEPFVEAHVSAMLAALVGVAGFTALAVRDVRAASGPRRDLWREPRAVLALVGVVVLGLVVSVERVPTKRRSDGTKFRIAASKYLMQFPSHVLNQAVVNPLVDLAIYHLPAALKRPGYRLGEAQSLATTLRLLHLSPQDPAHPLLRSLHGDGGLGIRNVVVVMVEGLGTAILDHRAEDGAVMPFLAGLAAQGLYFPRCYQSFSSTDGSVFAVTTSLNRSFAAHARTPYFFPYEFGGSFGSLPRVLGSERYRHFFFAGFRQRIAEFVSFAANQGFEAFGYDQLVRRLGERAHDASSSLGIFDHVLLDEAASTVLAADQPFTLEVMTGTSHSPWVVPDGFEPGRVGPELATFRYVDAALRAFVERLRRELDGFDATLFVITGDHTSFLPDGDHGGDRFRVPLVLWSTALAARRAAWTDRQSMRASHVDVLPTVLGRIPGAHPFAGMGRDLLTAPLEDEHGIVSGSHHESLYLKGGFALRYTPLDDSARLSTVDGEQIGEEDVASAHPAVVSELRREVLSLYETADRLAHAARVFPRDEAYAAALRRD
jgi:hypothetical protein